MTKPNTNQHPTQQPCPNCGRYTHTEYCEHCGYSPRNPLTGAAIILAATAAVWIGLWIIDKTIR